MNSVSERSKKTKYLVVSALLAAIICVVTGYILHIPVGGNGGYVHVGDAFIYIGAAILPLPYAIACASIGAAMADFTTGATMYVIPTLMIKGILVLFISRKSDKIVSIRNIVGSLLAGIIGTLLYMIADGIMFGSFSSAFVFGLISLVQPVGSFIVFIVLGMAFDKLDLKKNILK